MKLKNIFSLLASTLFVFSACSPDDYEMGGAQYTADQLKAPDAYTVDINGNRVTLTSKLVGCTPLWITSLLSCRHFRGCTPHIICWP